MSTLYNRAYDAILNELKGFDFVKMNGDGFKSYSEYWEYANPEGANNPVKRRASLPKNVEGNNYFPQIYHENAVHEALNSQYDNDQLDIDAQVRFAVIAPQQFMYAYGDYELSGQIRVMMLIRQGIPIKPSLDLLDKVACYLSDRAVEIVVDDSDPNCPIVHTLQIHSPSVSRAASPTGSPASLSLTLELLFNYYT